MTNKITLTSKERERIITLILEQRAKDNPTAGPGYFAAARKGLETDTDATLAARANKMGIHVNATRPVPAPLRESKYKIGETRTFVDGRTGTVVDTTPPHTMFEMSDGSILCMPN